VENLPHAGAARIEPTKRKGGGLIWSGVATFVLSILIAVVLVAVGFGSLLEFGNMRRIKVPSTQTLPFEAGRYAIYDFTSVSAPTPGSRGTTPVTPTNRTRVGDLRVTVTSGAGEEIPLVPSDFGSSGTSTGSGNTTYTDMWEFTIQTAGSYEVKVTGTVPRTTAPSSQLGGFAPEVAIGRAPGAVLGSSLGPMAVGVAVGGLGTVVGLILFIVGLVRRSGSKPPPAYPPPRFGPPPFGPPGYGPPGYGPPGR